MSHGRAAARARIVSMLILSGCLAGGEDGPPDGREDFEQTIDLDIEGSSVMVPLEGMDVWLTEDDDSPESCVLHGVGTSLGGTFPRDVRVGYEDDWRGLVGRAIAIAPRHLTMDGEAASIVTVPGAGRVEVLGGQLTIEKVDGGWEARTPLTGRIELQVRGGAGVLTLRGRLQAAGSLAICRAEAPTCPSESCDLEAYITHDRSDRDGVPR